MQKRCLVLCHKANGGTLNAVAHGDTVPSLLMQEGVTTKCSPEFSTGRSSGRWSLIRKEHEILNNENLEQWIPLQGYEGKYEVSNYGRVRRLWSPTTTRNRPIKSYGKIFEPHNANNGYMRTAYGMQREYTHRLVARHFVPNPNNLPEVNHIDGNKRNNYYLNLEWCTRLDNCRHASATGLINHDSQDRKDACRNNQKIAVEKAKRPVLQVSKQGDLVQRFESVKDAANAFRRIHSSPISAAAHNNGHHKTAYGYQWIYEDEYDPTKDYRL